MRDLVSVFQNTCVKSNIISLDGSPTDPHRRFLQVACAPPAAPTDCIKRVADMWARDPGTPFAGFDANIAHIGTAVVPAAAPAKDTYVVVSHFGKLQQ